MYPFRKLSAHVGRIRIIALQL